MKKNMKVIAGITLGIIIGTSTIAGAATIFRSEDITYSSPTNKTNVKDSLDELYSKVGKCPDGWYCYSSPIGINDQVEIGDYIKIIPPSTSYTIKKEVTGYDKDQTINPSELDLWLVYKKYQSGDIRVVSYYGTTDLITFVGEVGYRNFASVLNKASDAVGSGIPGVFSTWSIGGYAIEGVCEDIYNCHTGVETGLDVINIIKEQTGTGAAHYKDGGWTKYWSAFRVKDYALGVYNVPFYMHESESYGFASLMSDGEGSVAGFGSASLRPIMAINSKVKIKSGSGTFNDPYILS